LINRVSRDRHRTDNIAKLIQAAGKACALPLISIALGAGCLVFDQNPGAVAVIVGVLTLSGVPKVVRSVTERRTSSVRRPKQ
jgi:hypothetical protein